MKKDEFISDKKVLLITFILFIIGSFLAFVHSAFAMLNMFFPAMVGVYICNIVSKNLFGKEFEYHSLYSYKAMKWSDILLSIPLLFFMLIPVFIIGEIADCHLGTKLWSNTFGICR